ncbi:MAG: RibD family protein [Anaerotignum sp.]|nr:RibD family protein [Anaerotignum sp.]
MNRPYIICHMTTSIDGKVTGEFLYLPESESAVEAYYEINRKYKADAYACGRVTMEGSFTGGFQPDLTAFADAKVERTDYIADKEAKYFAVAFDRKGRLGWTDSRIHDEDSGYDDAHIINVMCEELVSDAYLAYLRDIGVSYIFAGKGELDLPLAVGKLKALFGIEKLLLEGGSVINGAFQRDGLIDELSLVVAPAVAGKEDKPLFTESRIECYQLQEVKQMEKDVFWMNYKKK